MTNREKWAWRATMLITFALALWGSGIVPAVVPSLAPAANRRGTITKNGIFQLTDSTSAGTAGATFCDDGNGNTTETGCSAGGGSVTSVDGSASNGVETVQGGSVAAITTAGTVRGALPVNAQTGTSYTVNTTDRGKLVTHSNASAIAVTLPQASASFPANWYYYTENRGAGTVTITPTTSTIDGAASVALTTNQGIGIASDGANYFTFNRGTGSGGTTVSLSNGYLTVAGSTYCMAQLAPCTIPPTSSWTWANQGTSTVTGGATTPLYFQYQSAGGSDALRSYDRSAPGTFTVIAGFTTNHIPVAGTQQNGCGISVGDGTKYLHFLYIDFSAQTAGARLRIQKWNNTTSVGATYNDFTDGGNNSGGGLFSQMSKNIWMKLVLDSTKLTWSWSLDGVNYDQFDQRAKGDFLGTITTVGFAGYVNTAPNCSLVSWSGA
jgi:hypothetical protein